MAYNLTQLTTFFTNANAGTAPTAAQVTGLQSIVNQNATGALTDAQALQATIDLGSDITTAVSVQTYQFFLNFAPSVDGLKALNAAYVGSGAQAGLNGENRFIAQAVSLALQNPTAKASFTAAYGSASIADATAAAYNVIIGNSAAAAAGINVANAVAFLSSASSIAYFEAFVKANVPGLAAADVSLAVKAAIVGEIIYQATIYNNGAGLGSYAIAANNLVKDLADDGALTANNANGIDLFASYGIPTAPQTPVLTVSATDNITTGNGADTITGQWGQTTTLQASDKIDGGAGVDTLRIVTDAIPGQATAATVSGFTVSNVEVLEIQAQNANGTTLGLENVTGVTTIRSSASNSALQLDNVKAIAGLEVVNALNAGNLTVNYAAAAVSGSADTQNLALNGNAMGTLTVNGIETLAVTTATANSTIATLALAGLSKMTVAGDKSLTVTNVLANSVTTIDASAQTAGGITVAVGNGAVAVTGGAGADKVTFAAGEFTSADAYNGGAGRDTVVVAVADLTAAAGAKLSNVEIVELSTALTADFDTSRITGEDTYALNAGFTGPVSLTKVTDASTVNVKAASTGTLTVSIGDGATLATVAGTANTLGLAVGGANGVNAGTINAAGVETLTLASNGSAATAGGNTLTIVDADATKLTVTGGEDLALTFTGTALTTLDASGSTGANDFSLVTFKAATSATITGGSGADKINGSAAADTINGGAGADVISGGGGADTLTGGAGADTFSFSNVSDSSGAAQDTITDFVSGTDLINLQAVAQAAGRTNVVLRSGDAANFGAAQASILQNSGNTQVVFQADTNTLWVDLNDDGTLNNNDLAIKLTGVTKITSADIGGTATPGGTGNFITLSANAAVVNGTTNTNASAVTTAFADTITATVAQVNNVTTLDGLAGDDTLVLSDAAANVTLGAGITNVETLQLAAAGNNIAAFNAAGAFKNVTGSANADTLQNTANIVAGGTINLGAGNDTITSFAANLAGTTVNLGAGDDAITLAAGVTAPTTTFIGGDGVDTLTTSAATNLTGASISGFETLDIAANSATTLTLAQYQSFTNVATSNNAASDVTLTTAGTFTTTALTAGGAGVETYTLAAGTNNVTLGGTAGATRTITGTTGAETVTTTIANGFFTKFTGAAGADTLSITGGITAAAEIGTNAAAAARIEVGGVESLVIAGASTANVLTLVSNVDGELTSINASGVTGGGITLNLQGLASGADTATDSIILTAGDDVIQGGLNHDSGVAMTLDFGAGNATVADLLTTSNGLVTLKATNTASATTSITFSATTADFQTGSTTNGTLLDFNVNVTAIKIGAIGGAGTNVAGQVFIDNVTNNANTIITVDVDGNGVFGVGDIRVTLTGQAYTGATASIVDGNLFL